MNVGERMRAIRKQKKISADTLADAIGVSRSTIFRYEKGDIEKVPIEVVAKVALALGVKPQVLMGLKSTGLVESIHDTVVQLHPDRQQNVYTYAEDQLKEQQNENVVPFPEQREIVCGRGTAAGAPIDGATQDAEVRRTRVNVDDIPASADEIVTVEGDSMEPDYPKYSQIFVRWQDTIDDGDLAVVRVADEGVTFKQVSRDYQQKKIVLHSLNDKYPDRYLDPEDVSIIGVVIN
ncbi:MAG: XRE family transcriptional regulator [Lactobacillus sp.]|nr:XRE family transcriptional regulator [Lactobacillus sp.]MCI1941478.1 XRE family transcriptional regulator [Lactobacillus sp.]MCI1972011.1 XRE family transcriptional regulator [Lactobacillus sp.]MCI2016146.1 XRE family transcriptional regulator [Lactobacillus sp.]MCI2036421.1 XRE family transcriptional regulator [Lactobacillus sp.]